MKIINTTNRQINSPNATGECLVLLLHVREIAGSILDPRTPRDPPTFMVFLSFTSEFIESAMN